MMLALLLALSIGQTNYSGDGSSIPNGFGSPRPVDYCTGFQAGYRKGWCYDVQSICPSPPKPPCPPPEAGKASLEDGYVKGLYAGREAKVRLPTYRSPKVIQTTPIGPRPWTSFFN